MDGRSFDSCDRIQELIYMFNHNFGFVLYRKYLSKVLFHNYKVYLPSLNMVGMLHCGSLKSIHVHMKAFAYMVLHNLGLEFHTWLVGRVWRCHKDIKVVDLRSTCKVCNNLSGRTLYIHVYCKKASFCIRLHTSVCSRGLQPFRVPSWLDNRLLYKHADCKTLIVCTRVCIYIHRLPQFLQQSSNACVCSRDSWLCGIRLSYLCGCIYICVQPAGHSACIHHCGIV